MSEDGARSRREISYLTRALKVPTVQDNVDRIVNAPSSTPGLIWSSWSPELDGRRAVPDVVRLVVTNRCDGQGSDFLLPWSGST